MAMNGPGILRRLLGRTPHEDGASDGEAEAGNRPALDLADIQGFVLRAYMMPMVRHFLLTVGTPAQARRQLGRLVSGDESDVPQITTAADWHVGFAPGPGDNPADAPRCTPDYCLNIGITWPGLVALEIEKRVPTLSFKSFGVFVEGAAQRAELVGDTGASSPQNWIDGFGSGDDHVLVTLHAISPEAMTSYSDRLCELFAEGDAFREIWRQDGMALMEMQNGQLVPTAKVHFGYTDAITTPTIRGGPESVSARPPGALRAVALRLAGRRRELRGTRAASTRPERQLCRLQEGRDRRRRLRRLLAVEQRQDRSRTAGRKDVRAMAQRRSTRLVTGHGQPCGRDLARSVERFRVRQC